MIDQKKIFISIPNGLNAFSILRSGILDDLIKKDIYCHIISPLVEDKNFVSEFNQLRNVEVLGINPKKKNINKIHSLLKELAKENQISRNNNIAIKLKRQQQLYNEESILKKSSLLIIRAISKVFPFEFYFFLKKIFFSNTVYDKYFEKINPDLVLVGAPGTSFGKEIDLIIAAKKHNVKTIAIGMSWDHFSAKYKLIRPVDRLIVWNHIMKNDAKKRTGIASKNIFVGGIPHFKYYQEKSIYLSKDQYFRKMSLDPKKKLILVVVEIKRIYKYYDCIIDQLLDAANAGYFSYDSQILVRLHPYNDFNYVEKYKNINNVIVEWPYKKTSYKNNLHLQVDFFKDDQIHLINTLKHADVVVGTTSTISLESCVVNTPIINIGYDGNNNDLPYYNSIKAWYDFPHYRKLLEYGAIRIVENKKALINTINEYLTNPEIDTMKRENVKKDYIFNDNNSASKKYSNFIINNIYDDF